VAAHVKIGEAASAAGVTAKAIRFYESAGLLPAPARGPNGYRLYTSGAIDTLRFIKQASGLGLSLSEIKEILVIRQGGQPPCTHATGCSTRKRGSSIGSSPISWPCAGGFARASAPGGSGPRVRGRSVRISSRRRLGRWR
jgi:hypothetical protein